MKKKICVVGGGFFGCMAAIKLARAGHAVDLLERNIGVMLGASRNNHNRIHMGYHYLRSIQTARDSIQGLDTFTEAFGSAIRTELPNYYAIAAEGSKTTPDRFEEFCQIVRIKFRKEAPPKRLLNPDMICASYCVPEPVFDYFTVREIILRMLSESTVDVHLRLPLQSAEVRDGQFLVKTTDFTKPYDHLINASYNDINRINAFVGAPLRTLRFDDVLIPVFRFEHAPIGLTVMDGPFCSVMPRGFRTGEFLLYHVTHSVLRHKLDTQSYEDPQSCDDDGLLFAESSQYFPFLAECKSIEHYRAIRATWENDDDARRSIVYDDIPNYWSILSGKVTTCIDVANELVQAVAK